MPATTYVLIAVIALAAIAVLVFLIGNRKRDNRLTPLASVAFGFVIAGAVFGGDNRTIGYSLIAVGVVLAVADSFLRRRG